MFKSPSNNEEVERMTLGLVGRKLGMSRLFMADGRSQPVTVIEVLPNRVTQIKTLKRDGYTAIQVTTGFRKRSRLTQAQMGHFAVAEVEAGRGLWEFRVAESELARFKMGDEIGLDTCLKVGQIVDVRGVSKGKGFAGSVKRHNFRTQDATHGNSLSHRVPGSTGQNQSPGRVFKGKRMPGHLGNATCTIQNLEVLKIDTERNVVFIRGAIPGAPQGDVIVTAAVKAPVRAVEAG